MKLSKKQLAAAPTCDNCDDYVDEPGCRIVWRKRGWVHVANNSVRCPGQEDDDTDDRAEPSYEWVVKTRREGILSPHTGLPLKETP